MLLSSPLFKTTAPKCTPLKHLPIRNHWNILQRLTNNFIVCSRFRCWCCELTSKAWFDFIVLIFIASNCITLAMERPNIPPWSLERQILDILNHIFTVVFTIEMGLKVITAILIVKVIIIKAGQRGGGGIHAGKGVERGIASMWFWSLLNDDKIKWSLCLLEREGGRRKRESWNVVFAKFESVTKAEENVLSPSYPCLNAV